MRITTYYDKIKRNVNKSGICPKCGKKAKRSKEFYQTLNPFNRNANGTIKHAQDIYKELDIACKQWLNSPVYHAKCED